MITPQKTNPQGASEGPNDGVVRSTAPQLVGRRVGRLVGTLALHCLSSRRHAVEGESPLEPHTSAAAERGRGERTVLNVDHEHPLDERVMPVTLVLDRLRSAFNVGNIFRLAEALRAERVIACGYTAAPPHPKLAKTARGCDALVPCTHAKTATNAICELRNNGVTVYGVETTTDAEPVWDVTFTFPAAFVVGNEALGIEAVALDACDHMVCLPNYGVKNSVNVANCAAVVLYEAARQWRRGGDDRG